jgi:hypothetical protein
MVTVIGQMQLEGNNEMVRSKNKGMQSFFSIIINMTLLVSVAAGAYYAIVPTIA